jgi:hypothetical protein
MVYNFMYLCKFNFLLNEIQSETSSIFMLWLSMIMQIFKLDIPLEILNNN